MTTSFSSNKLYISQLLSFFAMGLLSPGNGIKDGGFVFNITYREVNENFDMKRKSGNVF